MTRGVFLACLVLLAGCANHFAAAGKMVTAPMECAPNGTCWPAGHKPIKAARVVITDQATQVCGPSLQQGWTLRKGNKWIACTIGLKLPQPFIILPTRLSYSLLAQGWSLELLRRYEQANADGVAVYPSDGPALPIRLSKQEVNDERV